MLIRFFYLLTGFLVAVLLCEAVLQLFPVATGYRYQAVNAQSPISQGEPGYLATYSHGWNFRLNQQHTLNNYGYVSAVDYRPSSQPVLVIGDSYVLASALNEQSHFAALLSNAIGISVYPISESGADLADYLAFLNWGVKEFQPKATLILISEKDILEAKTPEAGNYHFQCSESGCIHQRIDKTRPGLLSKVLNGSKLFRYLFDNLKIIPNLQKSFKKQPAVIDAGERDKFDKMMVDFFLSEVEKIIGKQNVVFIIKPESAGNHNKPESHLFKDRALDNVFHVIDLQDVFLKKRNQGVRLDFMPLDAHWNETAHQLTAQTIKPVLTKILAEQTIANKQH